MISKNTIKTGMQCLIDYFENPKSYTEVLKGDHTFHYYGDDIQIIVGFHTLKLCIIDNKNSNCFIFSPVKMREDDIYTEFGTIVAVIDDDGRKTHVYDTLFIESSTLFQLSLIHDINIDGLDILMYKYGELLELLGKSKINHNTKYIKEACDNLSKAHVQYSNE